MDETTATALWTAIGIIVTASVFITTFLQMRLHAALDRAIEHVDVTDAEISGRPLEQGPALHKRAQKVVHRLEARARPDVVSIATVIGNVVLLVFVILLGVVIFRASGWQFRAQPQVRGSGLLGAVRRKRSAVGCRCPWVPRERLSVA